MTYTIAIIEDNTDVRENLAEILELSGYKTITASNGKEGIQIIKEHKPDLILCDVMMPELDGFGVLKILNQNPDWMTIPFMFLTAKAEKSDMRKGMGLGADDYITKPFDDVELLEAIEMRLKKAQHLKTIKNTSEGIKTLFNIAKGEEALVKLSKEREERHFNKKDIIFEAGHFPRWLYFVSKGQVKSSKYNELGKELITQIYSEGDFLGYKPLLTDSPYDEHAVALEDTVLLLIPPEDFRILLYNNRDFASVFIKMLVHQSGVSEQLLLDLAYSSVRKKVANALLTLYDKYGTNTIKVMREDLAALAGTAKETTIRTLSDFKSEKLIDISIDGIELLHIEGLKEMPQ